ncbi:hypothetical protein F4678DRAFT_478144 [Xylaria arbuscula]|nr:hypothetical protein F4678DRAFT_478144 [Xylaria arbuscula]
MRAKEVQKEGMDRIKMMETQSRQPLGLSSVPSHLNSVAADEKEVAAADSDSELADEWDTVSVPDGNADSWEKIEDDYYSSGDESTTEEQIGTGEWLRVERQWTPPEQSLPREQSPPHEHEEHLPTSSGEGTNKPETKKPEHEEHLPTNSPGEETERKEREESEYPLAMGKKRDLAGRIRPRRYRQWSPPRGVTPAAAAAVGPVPPSPRIVAVAVAAAAAAAAAHQCKTEEKKEETTAKEEDSPEAAKPYVSIFGGGVLPKTREQFELERERMSWRVHYGG